MENPDNVDPSFPKEYKSSYDRYYPAASARLAEFFAEKDTQKALSALIASLSDMRSAEIYFFMQAIRLEVSDRPEAEAALIETCRAELRNRSGDWDPESQESTEN